MDNPIKILLVDDYEAVRYGLRLMLEQENDMEVIAECAGAREAFARIEELHPDIVLMDAQMPGMSGIEATRVLKSRRLDYDCGIIVMGDSEPDGDEALRAGSACYVVKDVTGRELAQVIRDVHQRRLSPDNTHAPLEETVEIVVPPTASSAHLLGFVCRLEGRLDEAHPHSVAVKQLVGSWSRGTAITLAVKQTTAATLADTLAAMEEVEKVEERPQANPAFCLPTRYGSLLRSGTTCTKRFRVTLKEASPARRELTAALGRGASLSPRTA